MSVIDLKAYEHRAATDPEVLAAAKAIGTSDLQGHIEFAQTLGYAFSADDLIALVREQKPDGDQLTDEELASISGGNILDPLGLYLQICGEIAETW